MGSYIAEAVATKIPQDLSGLILNVSAAHNPASALAEDVYKRQVLTGTFKTLLGFQVLSAGSAIIVTALTYFGKIFQHGFHLKGVVPSIEAINGQATVSYTHLALSQ